MKGGIKVVRLQESIAKPAKQPTITNPHFIAPGAEKISLRQVLEPSRGLLKFESRFALDASHKLF